MPRKNRTNHISLRMSDDNEVISFFTSSKRNHFATEAKIFDALEQSISAVDQIFTVYLTTYPLIAVHVVCGNVQLLKTKQDQIKQAIQDALESQLRQT